MPYYLPHSNPDTNPNHLLITIPASSHAFLKHDDDFSYRLHLTFSADIHWKYRCVSPKLKRNPSRIRCEVRQDLPIDFQLQNVHES